MDFRDLKYKIEANKTKILLVVGIISFILAAIGLFKAFNINFGYSGKYKEETSEKYVLAEGILGANVNGIVNLYNPESGEKLDSKKLEGETFIYDKDSSLETLIAYDVDENKLYEVKAKGKKILISNSIDVGLKNSNILNFDYENKYFVGLLANKKSFVCKNLSKKKESIIDLKLTSDIDSYRIVKNNLLFTSENYIYTVDLTNNKHKKIDIGESSLSIHSLKNKVYIHNAFGYERNKSILLDINPTTLYINNVYQFKDSNVNILETSSNSGKVYYSEEFLTSKDGKVTQVIKSLDSDMKKPVSTIKYTGEYSISKLNSYGNLGYIYYHEKDTLKIFSLKSLEEEYSFNLEDDTYMPIY